MWRRETQRGRGRCRVTGGGAGESVSDVGPQNEAVGVGVGVGVRQVLDEDARRHLSLPRAATAGTRVDV